MRLVPLCLLTAACGPPLLPQVDDPCATWEAPGTYRMVIPGRGRTALVHVPDSEGPRTTVVALHGGAGTPRRFAQQVTALQDDADGAGFVVAYPAGFGGRFTSSWNAGGCCGAAVDNDLDDVAFLDEVVDALNDQVCADRIVAVGHSNGGMMAQRWACESDAVDGVVAASGALFAETCAGDPIPVTVTVGTEDDIVPPQGGPGFLGQVQHPVATEAFEAWRARNRCDTSPEVDVDGRVTTETWSCGATTRFLTLDGFGHQWPGGRLGGPGDFDIEALVVETVGEVSLP